MSETPTHDAATHPPPHIGVFDSGIGGLSVLAAVRRLLPGAATSYLADTAHAPWGDRSADWVAARCQQMAAHLVDGGAQLVLVACNTATTQAITALRAQWPGVPFVGVEPGVKPAVAATRNGRVAVIGTTGTMRSERLQRLVADHAADVDLLRLPCPGLVDAIERSTAGDDPALAGQLDHIARTLREADVDTVVLGCTHYPLVAEALASRLGPGVQLLDTGDAVARRVASQLPPAAVAAAQSAGAPGALQLWTTGDAQTLAAAARRWLPHPAHSHRLDLPHAQVTLRD
jgi:glutamate racemase